MNEPGSPRFDAPNTLYVFVDYISHNAYLAWARLPALCARHGLSLEPVPVLFAALLQRHGQRGPAEVAPKREWMLANVLRKAREDGTPIRPPASHPFNPLAALRATAAVDGRERMLLADRLFRATWAESRPVHESGEVLRLAEETGLDVENLGTRIVSETVKQRLRGFTEAAIAAGVFGVPTMRVNGENFFGYDDLSWLDRLLSGDEAARIDADAVAAWAEVMPSAQRRVPDAS